MTVNARDVYVGIDSGTQSTKVLLVDGDTGTVLGSGSAPHELIPDLPPGHLEQHPQDWFAALELALSPAFTSSRVDPAGVTAIGVSGQQHGLVALDSAGEVIRPAKLWCDTSTAPQCERLLAQLGGVQRFIELTGNALPPGYTASKIAWLKEHEPANFSRVATILLPHDYLNYRLTGVRQMECGDASGTALLDVRRRVWCPEVLAALDADLARKLPPLVGDDQPCGALMPELASKWGMKPQVTVSAGGGDNMMSAIGTGNVEPGVITVSLGTSGTIFAYSEQPVIDPQGEVAAFCDSTGAWLPLVCTMNVTVATEQVKCLLGLDNAQLEAAAAQVEPGCGGLMLIPYLEGERTPNVPHGTGVWFGANRHTHTAPHFARAAMEGALLGLNHGFRRLLDLGITAREIRLTGGGSNSPLWRRIAASVFNLPVVCLTQSESAAYGAALQAKWCTARQASTKASIRELAKQWIQPREDARVLPDAESVMRYRQLQALHAQVSQALRESFECHHQLVTEASHNMEPEP